MKHLTSTHITAASERVQIDDRADLDTTVINIGALIYEGSERVTGEAIHLKGSPLQRAAFLRHMGAALFTAADHLDRSRETTPIGGAA